MCSRGILKLVEILLVIGAEIDGVHIRCVGYRVETGSVSHSQGGAIGGRGLPGPELQLQQVQVGIYQRCCHRQGVVVAVHAQAVGACVSIAAIGIGRAAAGLGDVPAGRECAAQLKVFHHRQHRHAAGGAEAEGDSLAGVAAVAGVVQVAAIGSVGVQSRKGETVGIGEIPGVVVVEV